MTVPLPVLTVVVGCGLRSAVPLALALALSFVVIDTIPRMRGLDPAMINDLVRNARASCSRPWR
jgi:hypothetical protein